MGGSNSNRTAPAQGPALIVVCDDMDITGIGLPDGSKGVLLVLRSSAIRAQATFGMDGAQARVLYDTLGQHLTGIEVARAGDIKEGGV